MSALASTGTVWGSRKNRTFFWRGGVSGRGSKASGHVGHHHRVSGKNHLSFPWRADNPATQNCKSKQRIQLNSGPQEQDAAQESCRGATGSYIIPNCVWIYVMEQASYQPTYVYRWRQHLSSVIRLKPQSTELLRGAFKHNLSSCYHQNTCMQVISWLLFIFVTKLSYNLLSTALHRHTVAYLYLYGQTVQIPQRANSC